MNPFELLLNELESNQLVVVLTPCKRYVNEGGCVRTVAARNAAWYRAFCGRHASGRRKRRPRFDTAIKRRNIVSVLTQLATKGRSRSLYAAELTAIAAQEARKMGLAA